MAVSAIEESVRIPAGLTDHEAFRRWARSDDFPENGRISLRQDEIIPSSTSSLRSGT